MLENARRFWSFVIAFSDRFIAMFCKQDGASTIAEIPMKTFVLPLLLLTLGMCGATYAQAPATATASAQTDAKAAEPKPKIATPKIGQYIVDEGWGVLDVMPGKNSKAPNGKGERRPTFRIESSGSNAHSCSLEGEIDNGVATLEAFPPNVCRVSFAPTPWGVSVQEVNPEKGNCRYFCGLRASFDGDYRLAPAGCTTGAVRKARDNFKKAYDQKRHAEAATMLAPILARCEKTFSRWETANVRNDLAINYFHLKDKSACLAVLAPLIPVAGSKDAAILEEYAYAPSDAEGMVDVAKATRVNLKKCRSL
jgi:hypothetical protein